MSTTTVNGKSYVVGQMYVELRIPQKQTHPYPIVMVHGGTRSGTTFTGTPDGRESWAQYFARRGYAVYVVDQPGRGRSAVPVRSAYFGAVLGVFGVACVDPEFLADRPPRHGGVIPQYRRRAMASIPDGST